MIKRGIATFTLDYGQCPKWLFERMVKLGREIVSIISQEYGPDEFVKRIADPVWFQSLGTVLAFDWNASGLTTILTAALKESIRGQEKELGIFICGGKGKTSRKTPEEIEKWGTSLSLPEEKTLELVQSSKLTAKVDTSLIQDGYQIYHHSFFFSENGSWAVVQQGMKTENQTARRYHWFKSAKEKIDFVEEPHKGIVSQLKSPTLNLSAKRSRKNREVSLEIVSRGNYQSFFKDLRILRKHSDKLSKMITLKYQNKEFTLLNLARNEFSWHPVLLEDFSKSRYLEKIFSKIYGIKPKNYQELLSIKGVGPKTIRALSLVSEVIYGAEPSYQDPARYSFAHGGKDATPYPVDRRTYDSTISILEKAIKKAKIENKEKNLAIQRLENLISQNYG